MLMRVMILLLLVLLMPKVSWCDGSVTDFLSSYRVTVGVSSYAGEFDVFDNNVSPSAGTMTENFSYTPYVQLGSPYKFFGETDIGVLMEYDFTSFSLNKQATGEEDVDLGTSVEGYSMFATPTLIISLLGRQAGVGSDQSLIIGTGFGVGYLRAEGDIIFTETTGEKKDIDISSLAFSLSVFTDYRFGNFVTRISIDMTSVPRSDIEYRYTGFSLRAGYVFGL